MANPKSMTRSEILTALAKPSRSKYNAVKCTVGGEKFDSIKEANRWKELCLLQKAKKIRHLRHHVTRDLYVYGRNDLTGTKVGVYTPDFEYYLVTPDGKLGGQVIEDVKSLATSKDPLWRFKLKVLRAIGIDVTEVI